MHILLLKNNEIQAQTMIEGAKARGWTVTHVSDIFTVKMALLENIYAIILIDLDAEQELRLAILHEMRQRYDVTPILLMTEQDQPYKRIAWLEAGADDCLVHPFELDELWARVRAVTRRSEGQVVPLLTCGDIEVNVIHRTVKRSGRLVSLSRYEYRTLLVLMQKKGQVVMRSQLEALVYAGTSAIESNTLAVFICQVRRKLGCDFIETVYGQGYAVVDPTK